VRRRQLPIERAPRPAAGLPTEDPLQPLTLLVTGTLVDAMDDVAAVLHCSTALPLYPDPFADSRVDRGPDYIPQIHTSGDVCSRANPDHAWDARSCPAPNAEHDAESIEREIMDAHAFDAIARRTADSVSRRRSLLALGGAALAASLALPQAATAKQNRKGKGKNNNNGKDRCKAQVGKCQDGIASLCLAIFEEDSPECTELFSPCCRFLQNCETAQAFACAVEVFESLEP